jgi:hypothetical protein
LNEQSVLTAWHLTPSSGIETDDRWGWKNTHLLKIFVAWPYSTTNGFHAPGNGARRF